MDEDDATIQERKARLWGAPRARGFFAAADYVRETIRDAGGRRGFAEQRLLTRWPEIVGADVAAIAWPVRVSYAVRGGFGATLVIGASGAHGPELKMQEPQIVERINRAYGYNAVSRVHIDQSAPRPAAAATPGGRIGAPLSPARRRAAAALAAPIADDRLRSALERLGRNVMSRSPGAPVEAAEGANVASTPDARPEPRE